MRRVVRLTAVARLFALTLIAFAPQAFAAAQLKAGAKTSAQPTATNPQQRQLQITFDPVQFTPGEGSEGDPNTDDFRMNDFRLSVQYDPTVLSVQSIFFVPPFTENGVITDSLASLAGPQASTPLGQQAMFFNNNPQTGFITNITGSANPNNVPPGDVNNFVVNFILNTGVSLDTPLFIRIFGGVGDYVLGTDPTNGDQLLSTPPDIQETILNLSFNQLAQAAAGPGGASTPLPSGAYAGGLLAAGLIGCAAVRRRLLARAD